MPSVGPQLPPHLLARPSAPAVDVDDDDDDVAGSNEELGPQLPPSASAGPQLPTAGPSRRPSIGPARPSAEDDTDDEDAYAPALPPGFASRTHTAPSAHVRGPAPLPSRWPAPAPAYAPPDDDDSDDDGIGPMPLPTGVSLGVRDPAAEFREQEERRRKAVEEAAKPKKMQREEWMLKPPSSSDLLSNIDPTKLQRGGRRFQASRKPAAAKDADGSLWTETPAERQQRLADEVAGKRRRAEAGPEVSEGELLERKRRRAAEEHVRKGVEDYTAKHRGVALVDQHSSTHKPKDANEPPPALWDHARDMGLGGRLMDDATRARLIKDAKGLGDRFGHGSKGGFM